MLRYLTLCLTSAVTVLALALLTDIGALAGGEGPEAQAQTSAMQGDLVVESRTATSITGVYGHAGSNITFTSEYDPAMRTTKTNLIVNGSPWRYREDAVSKTSSISGAGASLSIEDQDALIAFMEDMDLTNISNDGAAEQEFSLYRTVLFLTEVPVGWEMPVITDESTDEPAGSEPTATTVASWSAQAQDTQGAADKCKDLEILGNLALVAAACQRSDNDDSGPNYPGVDYLTCETKTRGASYDWSNKCFATYSFYSGPGQDQCRGRCGKLCGGSGNSGAYTQDCLDHDKCVKDAGTRFAPGCTDELRKVYRDARAPHNCGRG